MDRAERKRNLERQRLRLLLEINNALVGNLDREPLFEAVAETLRSAIPFDRASLVLYDAERDVLRVGAVAGAPGSRLHIPAGVEMDREGSHLQAAVDERRPVECDDLAARRRTPAEESLFAEGIRSYAAVPLIAQDRVLGTLAIGSRASSLAAGDVELLAEIAGQVALAVDNMLAYEEIGKLKARLELENRFLEEEIQARRSDDLLGESPAMKSLKEQIGLVAPTGAGVLVLGESGTGKELVAREVHRRSDRRDRPMVKVNCASIPRDLYESEFFGHVKGAFTGAVRDRPGRFELADGGTLFLDEVGEIPLDLQGKFLRVLQEGRYERVGEGRTRRADVRIVAATNRNLRREVEKGRFRRDLYYRLNVFPLTVAPLRERRGDVALLASHFLAMACRRMNRPERSLAPSELSRLEAYHWPGNVRELENVIERALILSPPGGALVFSLPDAPAPAPRRAPASAIPRTYAELRELERSVVAAALERANGKVHGPGGAAELLGVAPSTLFSRMKAMGLRRK